MNKISRLKLPYILTSFTFPWWKKTSLSHPKCTLNFQLRCTDVITTSKQPHVQTKSFFKNQFPDQAKHYVVLYNFMSLTQVCVKKVHVQ